jgi:hypothetical protein
MLKKIGNAMKVIAQRSLLRGNRGAAQAVTEFGLEGMRSNLHTQSQNTITQHVNLNANTTSKVSVDQSQKNIKAQVANSTTHTVQQTQTNSKLGSSVLDALK